MPEVTPLTTQVLAWMATATLAEIVLQEREAGKTDAEIAALFERIAIPLPDPDRSPRSRCVQLASWSDAWVPRPLTVGTPRSRSLPDCEDGGA